MHRILVLTSFEPFPSIIQKIHDHAAAQLRFEPRRLGRHDQPGVGHGHGQPRPLHRRQVGQVGAPGAGAAQVAAALWRSGEGEISLVAFRSVARYVERLLEVAAEGPRL